MITSMTKLAFAGSLIAATAMLSTASAYAQKTETVEGGSTTVTLSKGFVTALSSLKVTPGTVAPTQLFRGRVNFPITGGALDLDTASGQILHSGGLTLTAGKTVVKLQSFIIDTTGTAPVISGLVVVDGKMLGRLTLFDLALPSGLTLPLESRDGFLVLKGVGVTLDAGAATALNSVFDVTAFAGGFDIGTADVVAFAPSHLAW